MHQQDVDSWQPRAFLYGTGEFFNANVQEGSDQQQNVSAVADTVVGGLFLGWEVLGFCTDR